MSIKGVSEIRVEFTRGGRAESVHRVSLVVVEAGHLALRSAYESNLRAYRDGGRSGLHAWLLYAAEAQAKGAELSPLHS